MSPSKGGSLCTPGVPGWPAVMLALCIWVALVAQPGETATTTTPASGCGETYTGDSNNVGISITSHNYEPWGCTWTFTVTEGKFAALLLENYMYLQDSKDCSKEYIKIYAGTAPDKSQLLEVLCGYVPSGSAFMSTSNSLFVEYHSDGSTRQFYANVKYLALNSSTPDCGNVALTGQDGSLAFPIPFETWGVVQNGQCRWVITVNPGYVIQLAFDNFDANSDTSAIKSASFAPGYDFMDPCAIFESDVKIFDGQTEGDTLVAKLCEVVRPWLITSTTNSLLVVATMGGTGPGLTRGSLRAHYIAVPAAEVNRNCGDRTLSGTDGMIASPNFPNNYDDLLDCEWLITVEDGYSIQITISQYAFEYSPNCMYDSVQIMYGDSILSPRLLSPSCDNDNSSYDWMKGPFTSLFNQMFIKFVTNWNTTSTGFNATWTRVCGKTIISYTTGGTVQPPLYPQDYPGDQHCEYKFLLSKPGEKLVLSFNNFQLEQPAANGSCVNDYLEIAPAYARYLTTTSFPPELSTETRRYCGGSLPPQFTSYSTLTTVRFVTNSNISAPGFQLNYNFYTAADCGQSLFTNASGTIHSPGYPGSFPPYAECNYTIRATQGQTIQLQFDFLNMRGYPMTSECSLSNGRALLEIFDGEGTAVTHIATFCNTYEFPYPVIFSAGATMTLLFRSSDNSMFSFGFSATYTATEVLPGKIDGWCNETSPCEDPFAGCDNNTCVCQSPYQKANMAPSCELYDTTTPQQTSTPSTAPTTTTDLYHTTTPQQTSIPSTAATTTTVLYDTTTPHQTSIPSTAPTTTAEQYHTTTAQETTSHTTSRTTSAECGQTHVTGYHGYIQLPYNYNNNYDHTERSCTWYITADVGRTILLALNVYFSNNMDDSCEAEFVKIYDGPTKDDHNVLGTFCRQNRWHFVESRYNSLVMEFYTNGFSQYISGSAEYSATGSAYTNVPLGGAEGKIALLDTNGDVLVWMRNGVCRWTITVEEGFVIQLAFEGFNIDLCSATCNYDYSNKCRDSSLTVYDGEVEQENAVIGKVCGWDQPWLMTSTTNSIVVVLVLGQEGNFTRARLSAYYRAVDGSQVNRDCGDGTLSGTGGVITSPNFPSNYGNQLDCEWIITVDVAFSIQIEVWSFSVQSSPNCMYDSVQVRDGNNISAPYVHPPFCEQRNYYNYNNMLFSLSSNTNEMYIRFVTDLTDTSTGFNATWSIKCTRTIYVTDQGTLQSPHYPENYPSDLNCQYTIHIQPGTLLVFSFASFNLEPASSNGSCVNDYVEISEQRHWMDASKVGRRERFCGSTLPADFTTYYHTVVSFVTDGQVSASGYRLTYNLVNNTECGDSFITGQQGTITSPNYPGSFPRYINCTQTIQVAAGETISLVFDDWVMSSFWSGQGSDGEQCLQMYLMSWMSGGVLEIYDGAEADNASNAMAIYCGQAAPLPVTSTNNSLTLVFRSVNNWNFLTGFSATFTASENSSVFTDCGGEISGSQGVITSPAYPEHYPNNSVCVWLITVDPGDTIRLSFVDVDLEDSDSCQLDSVEIRDGSNEIARRLDRVCGDVIPLDITSTGSVMHVKFVSDLDTSRPGFKATWISICEQIFRTSTGTIVSPSSRGHRKQCTYIIEQREWSSLVVRLQFQHFYLGGNASDCRRNYVEVRDGGFEDSPLIGQRYCGNSLPPVLTTSHNMMWIRYVTDGLDSNAGFNASFSLERPSCGTTTLTDTTGTFTSPGYPNGYPAGVECTWNIVAPDTHKIQLTFNTFLLERYGWYCWWEWVSVIDGANVHGPYCGVSAPDVITSTGNSLTVVFRSDWSINFDGFSASYVSYDPASDEMTRQYELYPFGLDNGDKQLPKSNNKAQKVTIKTGFPVGKDLQRKIFIGAKGVVSFGYREMGKKFELRANKDLICPYNADIWEKDPFDGGVYYQLHTDNAAVLTKASKEVREFTDLKDYTASLVLVVTWHRVRHIGSPKPDTEPATVQLALVSNGQRSFGLVYYQTGAMKWPYLREEPLVIGMSVGDRVEENIYSGTSEAFTSLDTIPGNTGRQGMWIYDIGDSYSADQACQDWYTRNLRLHSQRQQEFKRLPECPCNWWWLWGNWQWSHYRGDYEAYCFRMTVGNGRLVAPHGKECCYNARWWTSWEDWGQYLSDAPHAGSATAYNQAFWSLTADYYREDRQAHDICCYNTSSSDYCNMYYELRPIGECTTRIPLRFSWTWGDPHIKTLDGGEYTFNGWGEYTMISMTTPTLTFTLQGRTGLAQTEKGTVANATVFTAFGAQENGVRVTVDLDPNTNNTLIVYGNGTDYTTDFYQNGNDFQVENEAYLLKNTNSSLEVRLTSGIQLTISIGYKSLDISISMPLEFQGQTKGLLGNFNGVKDDDFVLPDGTTLSSDLTDRQIYEKFGPAWAVTEANTVLRYPPREGPANYTHPQFQPIFLDEQPADVRRAAEELCGAANLACVYDYVATGSEAIATSSNKTASSANRTEVITKNTVPVLKFNNTVRVNSGLPATFNLQGHDPDNGDTLTYHVVGDVGSYAVVDQNSGDVRLNLDASSPVSLSFYAVDSNNVHSPKRDVTIIVCSSCSGHGTCDVTNAVASDVKGFMIAPCSCEPAWTGPGCGDDYDACLEHPCSNQQVCTDLTPTLQGASTTGFTCSACSDGYVVNPEDSTSCIDVDECTKGTANCTSRCINLPGYFACGCDVGYRLNDDGVICDDINECADRTAGCQQGCVNTGGSYNCTCFSGYTLSTKGTCDPDHATAELCSQAGCAHGCTTETDPVSGSTVPSCFCNAGYAPSPSDASACVDVDECSQDVCSQACTNTVGSFACTCYTGHVLGADQRTCTPCQGLRYGPECRLTCACNGRAARCDPVTGCVCASGWTGSHCERDVDECAENPDVCGSQQICKNTLGSYVCSCPVGYKKDTAENCEDINECSEGYLQTTCGELETCHNVEGSYYCSCISGYRRQEGQCRDVDECSGSTQRCEQLCINRPGSFNCDCYYGYRLDQERTHCIQVGDVCKEFEGLDCDQGCTIDDRNVAACFCNAGYKLASDGETCLDADECSSGVASCSHACANTLGGFNCTCPVGKTLDKDGKTCQDCPTGYWGENCIRQCACGIGATGCDAATGCVCKPGWTGAQCDQDVNECDTASAQLECQAVSAECYNYQGGYRCQCPQGYKKDSAGVCQDFDECANSPCSQLCENTPGSFRCLCNKGYRLSVTTGTCQDIDECALSFTNNCTQLCVNTPGGYRCDCNVLEFQLQNDGFTCKATSLCNRLDCPTENGGCSQEQCFCNSRHELSADRSSCSLTAVDYCSQDVCAQNCANSPDGTPYTCSCRNGYLLNSDKSTCRECRNGTYGPGCTQTCACNTRNSMSCNKLDGTCTCMAGWKGVTCDDDIDECNPPSSTTCTAHAHCVNIKGGHLCSCDIGFTKVDGKCVACDANHYGENCAQRCGCGVNSVSCDKVSGACSCKAGWEGPHCDVDVDECTLGSAGCSGDHVVCVNTEGGFSCDCDQGYTRDGANSCVDKDECFTKESDCLHVCNNTIGAYVCSCGLEYQGTGNDCTELAQESVLLTVDIPVPASELANPYSQIYKAWVVLVQQMVYDKIKPRVPGLKGVIVRSLRHGSLISDTGFVLDTQAEPNSMSALSSAIMAMIREQLTLDTYTGSVSVNIHGIMVSENMTLCDVYETFSPCGTNQECRENSGIASCGPSTEESEEDNLGLIIGLAVAIPVVLLIAGVVALAVYFHKRSNVHTLPLINHDEVYGVAPAPSNLYGGKPGVGPADAHLRAPSPVSASPVPSLDSIEPSVDCRPPSRTGSWVANM